MTGHIYTKSLTILTHFTLQQHPEHQSDKEKSLSEQNNKDKNNMEEGDYLFESSDRNERAGANCSTPPTWYHQNGLRYLNRN